MGRTRQFGTIKTRPRQNGAITYQASFLNPHTGKRISKSFRSRRAANAFLAETRQRLAEGQDPTPAPPIVIPTVKDWSATWLDRQRAGDGSPNSIRSYKSHLRVYILPTFKNTPVDQVTRKHVQAWYYSLDPAKPGARRNAYRTFSALMGAAIDAGFIETNPVRVKGALKKDRGRDENRERVATDKQVTEIAALMPDRLAICIYLAAWAGLRYGEIAALRRKHVNLEEGFIKIRAGVKRGETGGLTEGPPKSARAIRDVPISPLLAEKLRAHLHQHAGARTNALLVTSTTGGFLSNKSLHIHYDRAVTKVGLPGFTFHQLRATCATMLARSGATEAEIQAILGHASWSMSQIYQRAPRDRLIQAVTRMHSDP